MWLNFFDKIYLINLLHRQDRLLKSAELLEEYGIPYERVGAIYDPEQGARGLRNTMLKIFSEVLENSYKNVLILEDDLRFVVGKELFHHTMDSVVNQIPENYLLCYLGGQPTNGYSSFYSANLLPVTKYFATHSVIYSLQGVKEIMIRDMGYPIDNWMTDNIQTQGRCYAVNPLLISQQPGVSDIGGLYIDWTPFIQVRHEQKINELNARR